MSHFHPLLISQTVERAWNKVKGSKATFFALSICYILVQLCVSGVHVFNSFPLLGFVIIGALCILQLFLVFSYFYLGVKRAADEPIEFKSILSIFKWGLLFRMLGVYIGMFLVILVSCIPYIIPGLLVLMGLSGIGLALISLACYIVGIVLTVLFVFRMYLAIPICIIQHAGPIQSIKRSFSATQGNVWRLLGLSIINALIIVISAIPFGIGLIWTIPYYFINLGIVYKMLVTDADVITHS